MKRLSMIYAPSAIVFAMVGFGCIDQVEDIEYPCWASIVYPDIGPFSPYGRVEWSVIGPVMPVDIDPVVSVFDHNGMNVEGSFRLLNNGRIAEREAEITSHTGRTYTVSYDVHDKWAAVFEPDSPFSFDSEYTAEIEFGPKCTETGNIETFQTYAPTLTDLDINLLDGASYFLWGGSSWYTVEPIVETWPEPSSGTYDPFRTTVSLILQFSVNNGIVTADITPLNHFAPSNWSDFSDFLFGPYGQDTCVTTMHDLPVTIEGLKLSILLGEGMYTGGGEGVMQRGRLEFAFYDQMDHSDWYFIDAVMDIQAHPFWVDGTFDNQQNGAIQCTNSTRSLCTWVTRPSYRESLELWDLTQYPIYQITQTQTENRWCLDQCNDGVDNDNDGMIDTDPECDAGW